MPVSPANSAPPAWLLQPPDAPEVEIWGLTPDKRLRRQLERAGCPETSILGREGVPGPAAGERALLLRTDWIYDDRLVVALAEAEDVVLVAGAATGAHAEPVAACVTTRHAAAAIELLRNGDAAAIELLRNGDAAAIELLRNGDGAAIERSGNGDVGLRALRPDALAPAYTAELRKFEPPYLLPARPELVRSIEDRTFSASYKGATDLVTKWVWPRPAQAVTRRLAAEHVHPNTITVASWGLAILAAVLFGAGAFGLGLVAAWLMTFLDTVDGKLARVTLTSSRLGHVLDHGLDLIHPPFWWLAWGLGLGLDGTVETATGIVVGGYFAGRLLEGIFLLAFKMETHCWQPIDTLFRTITARRNPNLLLFSVGTLGGRPDLGLVMVALWTLASLGFHTVRLVQAGVARARGASIAAWDEAPGLESRPTPGSRDSGGGEV